MAATTKTFIANIRGIQGIQGIQGVQGLAGVNGVENDTAVAGYISTAGTSATKTALTTKIDGALVPYAPSPRSFTGTLPAAEFGWMATYGMVPSIRTGRDGSVVGSVGITPEALFDAQSTARANPTVQYWVAPTGNDSTGTGTSGSPWRSIRKAIQQINLSTAGSTGRINLNCSDPYAYGHEYGYETTTAAPGFDSPTRSIALVATNGRAFVGPWLNLDTAAPSGTYPNCSVIAYSDAAKPPMRVVDRSWSDADGVGRDLVNVASAAGCNSTPGSWYFTGTALYMNRTDSLTTTNQNTWALLYKSNIAYGTTTQSDFWFEGIDFVGGRGTAGVAIRTGTAALQRCVIKDCTVSYAGGVGSTDTNGFAASTSGFNGLMAFFDCHTKGSYKDGFNWHKPGSLTATRVVTVNCSDVDSGALGMELPATGGRCMRKLRVLMWLAITGVLAAGRCTTSTLLRRTCLAR